MKNKYPLCFCPFKNRRFLIRYVSVFFFSIFFHIPAIIQAQNSEAQKEAQARLEKTAAEYFEQDDLTDAYPLYSQLLSLYPTNPNYKYRFGACMLYAGANKKAAIKYIQYALKQPSVENLAYYYMGRAFHLNYRFDEAISNYEKFGELASSSELKKHPVKQLIEMCRNGKQLLAASQPLDVLRKKQLNMGIFYEAYSMRSNGGVLIREPEEFKTKIDKKNNLSGLMYLTPDKQEAFFASYGNNEDNGKDIYCIRKKPDGTWGTAENLGNIINSPFDEDYPVYDATRNTLYFASKGHNSMGGYDIFSSVYNDTTQTWSEPYNLDFPINTPDDDILLVPDTSGQFAFFASARSSPSGKIEVYKIALHLHPPGTLVVAGTVHNGGAPAYAVITVKDSATNKIIATDTAQDGSYSLTLPQSGKYIFTVQDSAHKIQSKALMLSPVDNTIALEENIQLNASGSLQIDNASPEAPGSSNSQLALQYIEREAKMDVNVDTTAPIQKLLTQGLPDKSKNTLTASSENIPTNATSGQPVVRDTPSQNSNENNDSNNSGGIADTSINVAIKSSAAKDTSSQNLNEDNSSTRVAGEQRANTVAQQHVEKDVLSQNSNENNVAGSSVEITKNIPSNAIYQSPVSKDTSIQNPDDTTDNNSTKTIANKRNRLVKKTNTAEIPADSSSISGNNNPGITKNSDLDKAGTKVDSLKLMQLEEDKQQLDNKAGEAIDYANNKMEQARQWQERANNRTANSDSVSILSEKAKAATEKAMQAYKLASAYKSESGAKEREINETEHINSAPGTNQAATNNLAVTSAADLIRQQAKQVKADSIQLANANTEDVKEVNELQQKSADFVTQANQASDSEQKAALLQQADDLSKSKDAKQEEVKENNAQLQELHNQYAWLNNKALKADSISIASNGKRAAGDLESQVEVQKEIDVYATKGEADFASNPKPAINKDSSAVALNDTMPQSKHTRHSRRKKNKNHTEDEPGDIATSNSSVSDTAAVDNNTEKSVAQSNKSVTDNRTSEDETAQENVTGVDIAKDTNEANDTSADSSYSSMVSLSSANNIRKNYLQQPDTTMYYKQSHDSLLDSIADAMTILPSPGTFSSGQNTPYSSPSTTVQYTDTTASAIAQKSQEYLVAAAMLSDTAAAIRAQAKQEPDKTRAIRLYSRTDSINALVYQLNVKGNKITTEAGLRQYETNAARIKKITEDASVTPAKAAIAQLKLKDAQDSYKKSLWERDSAVTTSSLANRKIYMEAAARDLAQAIIKQQRAISIYFQADSNQAATAVTTSPDSHNDAYATSPNETLKITGVSDVNNSETKSQPSDTPAQNETNNNSPAKEEIRQEPVTTKQPEPANIASSEAKKVSSEKDNSTAIATENTSPADSASTNIVPEKISNTEIISAKKVADYKIITNKTDKTTGDNAITFNTTKNENTSVYSISKPIPIDTSLPSGVVFGVQIGAFRKPIPPDLFKGFEPIMGLKTPEGLVRYIAGTFNAFEPAKNAAAKIRNMGYAGAFVVAYYKGKRITIKEALAMLGVSPSEQARIESTPVAASETLPGNSTDETASNPQPAVSNSIEDSQASQYTGSTTIPSKKELIDNKRRDIKAIKDSIPPAAANINDVRGLVYTVQVGSFSKRKGFTRLQKIKHLYYWSSNTDGTIKYNSGIYTNIADARAARDIIVANTAVKDAFVTAYYQGQRITPAQAANLLSKGASAGKMTVNNSSPPANDAPNKEEPENRLFASASNNQVIYTVRIASFTGKLPVDTVNKLLSYANEGIKPYREQGVTTYYAGVVSDYESAEALRQKFYDGGFSHATVEAFYRGKKISLKEAQAIKNK